MRCGEPPQDGRTCPAWQFLRWAALGISPAPGAVTSGAHVEVGVRVRFEGIDEGAPPAVPLFCELTRNCADAALDLCLSPGRWMWAKRLLLDIDEEEGTGLWRLAKLLACGMKQAPPRPARALARVPRRVSALRCGGRLGRKRWASTPCSSLTSIRSSTRLPGAARGARCWASKAPGAPVHDGPTGATQRALN